MNLYFREYEEKYFDSCIELLKTTWDFHRGFKNLPDKDLVYQHYFYTCLNWNEHMEIIVDDYDNVKGILFGSIEAESYVRAKVFKRAEKKLKKWTAHHLRKGDFGEKEAALKSFKEFAKNDELGEMYADEFDSEINLFIVSPELRGMGYGIKLMDRYVEFCRKNKLKTSFLWTDVGCSFSFYNKYGFKLYKKYHSTSLTQGNKSNPNGMIYYLKIV